MFKVKKWLQLLTPVYSAEFPLLSFPGFLTVHPSRYVQLHMILSTSI